MLLGQHHDANDPAGYAELVELLRRLSIMAIGIEASGGYERGSVRALLAAGMPVRQVNPFKLRQFAKASGVLAKNDPLDARMIATFVAIMPTRPAVRRAPAIEQLAEMLAVRRQLSTEKVAAENASRLLESAMLQRLSRRRIARLTADIDMLDGHLAEIIGADAALERRYRLLTSMPGVGAVLACTLPVVFAAAQGEVAWWVGVLMGLMALGLGVPFLILAIWFPTMRYELDAGALTLRYGPVLTYRIPLDKVQIIERRDLRISIWSSVRLPGVALFGVPYRGVGEVKMCASAAARGILVIEAAGELYGITPADEAGLLAALEAR